MTVVLPGGIDAVMCCSNSGSVGSNFHGLLTNKLANFVRSIPGECHRHVIVITFILRNKHHTNIQIEIQQLEGRVKATGLFCLLGIGIGLGSLFIYKLYTRLFPKILLPPSALAKNGQPHSGDICSQTFSNGHEASAPVTDKNLPETPDSGISLDTAAAECDEKLINANDHKTTAASHCDSNSIAVDQNDTGFLQLCRRRNNVAEWLAQAELSRKADSASEADNTSDIYSNQRNAQKSLRSLQSSGYLSLSHQVGAVSCDGDIRGLGHRKKLMNELDPSCFRLEEDVLSDGVLSITDHFLVPSILSDNPEDHCDQEAEGLPFDHEEQWGHIADKTFLPRHRRKLSTGSNYSVDVPHLWLRRNRHSFSSDLSAASSGYTYRESLVSKGFSVDLGEDLTGIMTPPDGDTEAMDHWTIGSMDQLHKELRKIQDDINYMNEKVEVLLMKEDVGKFPEQLNVFEDERLSREDKNARRSRSLSPVRPRSCSVDLDIEELDFQDFMWDYHSDLALDKHDQSVFVVKRPHPVITNDLDYTTYETHNSPASRIMKDTQNHCSSRPYVSKDMDLPKDADNAHLNDENAFERKGDHDSSFLIVEDCSPLTKDHTETLDCSNCSHLNHHVCDPALCWSAYSFLNEPCSHLAKPCISSDSCSAYHKQMVYLHPHLLCSSCHGQRRSRPWSAGTRSGCSRPSVGDHCEFCRFLFCQKCIFRQAPSATFGLGCQCINSQISHCNNSLIPPHQSCNSLESRGSCKQSSFLNACQGTHLSKSQSPTLLHLSKDAINNQKLKYIGNRMTVQEHLAQELILHGCDRSVEIEKGFDVLTRLWGISSIRKIHKDNYSSLRAVLYQAMIHNLPIMAFIRNFQHCIQKLAMAIDSSHSYLKNWKFENQSALAEEDVIMKMTECLRMLFEQVEAVHSMSSLMCREQYLLALINYSPEMDRSLMEALKILMTLKAIDLFNDYKCQRKLSSSFVLQLFAKDSSKSMESFFNNHINIIGNTVSPRAVEMCLLGQTLAIRIEVIRPSRFNREDFVVHYPDEGADGFSKVHIIEEEEWTGYSVPLMKNTE